MLLVGLFLAYAHPSAASPPEGRISGTVIDRLTRIPIQGARVVIDEAELITFTDSSGVFSLPVPTFGVFRLQASAPHYATSIWQPVDVREDRPMATILLEIEPRAYRVPMVEIYGERVRPDLPQAPTQALIASDIRRAPGGFQDPLRALQESRAIESRNDLGTLLTIRGGEPDQVLFLMDGFDVYNPYRMRIVLGGGLSLANPDLIESVELYAGGFSARYGNRTSGLIHLRTRAGNRSFVRSRHTLSLVAASTAIEGPLPNKKGSWIVGLRRTYYDLLLHPPKGDGTQYPYLQEAQGRVDWAVSGHHDLTLRVSASDEGIDLITRGEGDTEDVRADGGSQITSISLEEITRLGGSTRVTTAAGYLLDRSRIHLLGIKGESLYSDVDSRANRLTTRHEWEVASPPHLGRLGFCWDRYSSEVDWLSDTEIAPSLNPLPDSLRMDDNLNYRAFYLEDVVALRRNWFLSLGIRIEDATGPSPAQASPRIALRGELSHNLHFRVGSGRFLQYPDGIQAISREAPLWMESLTSLPPENADLLSAGVGAEWDRLNWYIETYTRDTRDLLVPEDRETYRATSNGRALAKGVEIETSWKPIPRDGRDRSWFDTIGIDLAHAWSSSRFRGGIFEDWTTVGAQREQSFIGRFRCSLAWTLRFSSVLRLASGAPYTPLLGRVAWQDDVGDTYYHGIWGDPYSSRTAPYGRLDVRIERDIGLFGRMGTLFVEAINVTNRSNTVAIQWDRDFEERTPIYGLPLIPFIGLTF